MAIKEVEKTKRHLDMSEMGRCLAHNNKNGKGCLYSISSDRRANHTRFVEQGGEAAAENISKDKKKSRRRRDMSDDPLRLEEKIVTCDPRYDSPKKRKMIVDSGTKCRHSPPAKRPRRGIGDRVGQADGYISINKFTSLVMTPKEFSIAFSSSSSLRGAQRSKSLKGKYISFYKASSEKSNSGKPPSELFSKWSSPKYRKLVVVATQEDVDDRRPAAFGTLGFSITCKKSNLFVTCTALHSATRQWMKMTKEIQEKVEKLGKELPKMKIISTLLRNNLS